MLINKFFPSHISLDVNQESIVIILENYRKSLSFNFLIQFFFGVPNKDGIYVYGDVGRGKTMLMKALYDSLELPKKYLHYQQFMMEIHQSLKQHSRMSSKELASLIADSYSEQYKILFIDEFEINDITDAMLLTNFLKEVKKRKVFLLLTSNSSPNKLYKNGVLRERIGELITLLESRFELLNLDSNKDYRQIYFHSLERVIYPSTKDDIKKKDEILSKLKVLELNLGEINLFGRILTFQKTYNDILVTDFQEICQRNLSYSDYVEICKKYRVIVLLDTPRINNDSTDIITRFINLIDNVYFNKVLLFIFLEVEPELLYFGHRKKDDFKRCLSRLKEIGSKEYFTSTNYAY
jgi:cell division protein ZapE